MDVSSLKDYLIVIFFANIN